MKKSALLFIPLALSIIPLTSCGRDYKFNDPKGIIRNLAYPKNHIYLVYPYESNARPYVADVDTHIQDIDDIVVTNLKKASFTEGKLHTNESNKSIRFQMNSYVSSKSIGTAEFTLYDNGYIHYSVLYAVVVSEDNITTKKDYFDFTFDASLAETIISDVYAEFDRAKAEEERFYNTLTIESFFKSMKEEKCEFNYHPDGGSASNKYYDNKEVIVEMEKLEFRPFDEDSSPINRGTWGISYTNSYTEKGGYHFKYEGGRAHWTLMIDRFNEWAVLVFSGFDCYNKDYSVLRYYHLNQEKAAAFFENVANIVPKLKAVPNEQ